MPTKNEVLLGCELAARNVMKLHNGSKSSKSKNSKTVLYKEYTHNHNHSSIKKVSVSL